MQKRGNISDAVIRRLPRYYRFLSELLERKVTRISSRELSDGMGLTASQIRQDLNNFGGFGQQGYGYSVETLHKEIGRIIGLENNYRTIIIGAGNLGRSIAILMSIEAKEFEIIGLFDDDPEKTGSEIRHKPVMDLSILEEYCAINKTDAAVICVPKRAAPGVFERLYSLGIRYFWNFSNYDPSVLYDDIYVENVHLNDSLMVLCYKLSEKDAPVDKDAG